MAANEHSKTWAFFMAVPSLFLLLGPVNVAAAAKAAPNVLVVLTDDQGWGDLDYK